MRRNSKTRTTRSKRSRNRIKWSFRKSKVISQTKSKRSRVWITKLRKHASKAEKTRQRRSSATCGIYVNPRRTRRSNSKRRYLDSNPMLRASHAKRRTNSKTCVELWRGRRTKSRTNLRERKMRANATCPTPSSN